MLTSLGLFALPSQLRCAGSPRRARRRRQEAERMLTCPDDSPTGVVAIVDGHALCAPPARLSFAGPRHRRARKRQRCRRCGVATRGDSSPCRALSTPTGQPSDPGPNPRRTRASSRTMTCRLFIGIDPPRRFRTKSRARTRRGPAVNCRGSPLRGGVSSRFVWSWCGCAARGADRARQRSPGARMLTWRFVAPRRRALAASGYQTSKTLPRTALPVSSTVKTVSPRPSMRRRVPNG